MSIKIIPMSLSGDLDVVAFIAKEFSKGSVLHAALGVNFDDYREYLSKTLPAQIEHRLSFVAINSDSNEIAGCIVAAEFPA